MKFRSHPYHEGNAFKRCPFCGQRWLNRASFLTDVDVSIIGYQADFGEPDAGLFFFNHSCGTTLALEAGNFIDLYDGPHFNEKLAASPTCPGYCLAKDTLHACPSHCSCAHVRETLQIVRNWPKKDSRDDRKSV